MLLLAATIETTQLDAQDVTTRSAGGTGGEPFTIGCGNRAMAGVQGRPRADLLSSGQLGVIQALCVDVNSDGSWIGTPAPGAGIAGLNTPNSFLVMLTCPRDRAVAGISGVSAGYVDELSILCAPLGESGRLNGSAVPLTGRIGTASTVSTIVSSFGPFLCPDNKPGKGFTGRSHDWVDQVALVCNYSAVPATRVATVTASPQIGSPSVAVTLTPPELSALSLSAPRASPGGAVTGTVSLTGKAFAGGLAVEVASSDASAVAVPSTVTITAGQPSASFSATAGSHPGCSIITTTYNTLTQHAPMAVFVSASAAFTLKAAPSSTSIVAEVSFPAVSTLARPLVVASSNPSFASVPNSVQVAAGATTARFAVTVQGTTLATRCAVITVADSKGNGNSFAVVNADAKVTIISRN